MNYEITLNNSERPVIKAINWLLEIFRPLQRIVYSKVLGMFTSSAANASSNPVRLMSAESHSI